MKWYKKVQSSKGGYANNHLGHETIYYSGLL